MDLGSAWKFDVCIDGEYKAFNKVLCMKHAKKVKHQKTSNRDILFVFCAQTWQLFKKSHQETLEEKTDISYTSDSYFYLTVKEILKKNIAISVLETMLAWRLF